MEQTTRGAVAGQVVRVGADLAKRVIQVHAVDAAGRVVCRRALPRDKFIAWCARLPAGCVVAMEISSGAHHWARWLSSMGLVPRLMSAQLVEPYRSQGATSDRRRTGSFILVRVQRYRSDPIESSQCLGSR